MIVLTADCDLEQDYNGRVLGLEDDDPTMIPHVIVCDLYTREQIRGRFANKDLWKPVQKNQNERYHHVPSGLIGGSTNETVPDLYMDFRKAVGIPVSNVYSAIRSGAVGRIGVVPDVYIHDVMHRFYGYLSRVALPD